MPVLGSATTVAALSAPVALAAHAADVGMFVRFLAMCGPWTKPPASPDPAAFLGPVKPKSQQEAFLATRVHRGVVGTRDVDLMRHMNNARYLREADFARHGLFVQCGLFHAAFYKAGTPMVTGAQTIRYRKELKFRTRYEIRTRVLGWDPKGVTLEQLFVVPGKDGDQVHAVMLVREPMAGGKKDDAGPFTRVATLLGWDLPERQAGPPDVEAWIQSTADSSARVIAAAAAPTSKL